MKILFSKESFGVVSHQSASILVAEVINDCVCVCVGERGREVEEEVNVMRYAIIALGDTAHYGDVRV